MSEQLIKACKEGDLKMVIELLSKGADINYKGAKGMNALLWASAIGNLRLVEYLLTEAKPKASLTEKDNHENTALLLAAANGHTETVKYLLTKANPKASLTERNNFGDTALLLAAASGSTKTVKYLLTEANPKASLTEINKNGATALLLAAFNGHTETVKYLLTEAIPKASLTEKDNYGKTPLLSAAFNGHTETVKYLLMEATPKASLTEQSNHGNTALLMAAYNGHAETFKYLLTEANPKASLAEKNNFGNTALLMAAVNEHTEIVKYLLTEANPKASLTEKNMGGFTAFLMAAINGQTQTVKYLLTEANPNANLHERNNDGDSALSLSACKEHVNTVAYLLFQGAYIDVCSNNGHTPRQLCEKQHKFKAIPLLRAAEDLIQAATEKKTKANIEGILATLGIGINARLMNQKSNTALHLAIMNENIKVIFPLLEAGASLDIPNDDELTPYNLAVMSKIPSINMLGYIFKAKQLAKEITLQIQDGKIKDDKNKAETLEKPSIESLDSFGLEIKRNTEQAEMKKTKDEVKNEMEIEFQAKERIEKKENAEKAEKLKSELKATVSRAIECFETLEDADKQKVGFQLGSFLAQPENAPRDAVKAYEVLIQVNKSNQEFAKANALMYGMLLGKHLLLAKSTKPNGLGLDAEQEVIPFNPKDEAPLQQIKASNSLTLRAMIQHLLCSGLKDESLKNYLVTYTLGNHNGIAADVLNTFQDFQNPDSCLTFIDALRKKNLTLKGIYNAKEKEVESQKAKNDKQKKEIERLKHEMEVLKATLTALGAGSGTTGTASAAPLLSQFQSGEDTAKASDQKSESDNDSRFNPPDQTLQRLEKRH